MERTFFWRFESPDRKQVAARKGKWKYIRDGTIADYELLFDLDEDASERHDLAYQYPHILEELRNLTKQWEEEMNQAAKSFSTRRHP
jgi:arylsulfatase A-like enzyme